MFISISPKSTNSDVNRKIDIRFSTRSNHVQLTNFQNCWLDRLRPRRSTINEANSQSSGQLVGQDKWQTLQHNGPLFPAAYEKLPPDIHFIYDNCPIELTEQAEEVATFYAGLLKTEFVKLPDFNNNFFNDFRSCLSDEQRLHITSFELCNFLEIHLFLESKEQANLEHSLADKEHFGHCIIDGQRRRVAKFRIQPPGLCCPQRGSSPIMGMIRPRVLPEDVVINCDENQLPPTPPAGHHWSRVVHDRTVSWLYSWHDLVLGYTHYVYPSSEKSSDYRLPHRAHLEKARRLQHIIGRIRRENRELIFSEQWHLRQHSVALYCIDQLALSCDTLVDLRVEHLKLNPRLKGKKNVVQLQVDGENRQLLYKRVSVVPEIFYNLGIFVCGKEPTDLIFEELTAELLNEHLEILMDGLSSQIFRICNACMMLARNLDIIHPKAPLSSKLRAYNQALKEIHNFCTDRQRNIGPLPAPKRWSSSRVKITAEQRKLKLIGLQTRPLVEATLIYLDPRISIAWCLRHSIPINVIYQSSALRKKINWARKCTTKYFCF